MLSAHFRQVATVRGERELESGEQVGAQRATAAEDSDSDKGRFTGSSQPELAIPWIPPNKLFWG